MDLSFLKNLEVAEGIKTAKVKTKINRIPEKGDILVLKNGEIHFTDELIKKLDGKYIDFVFLSEVYEFKAPEGQEGLFFVPVEEKSPKASIKDKLGSMLTYVKNDLIPSLKEKLDIDLEILGKVEFKIIFNKGIKNDNGIFHFQKIQSSGKNKGATMPIRRENVELFPISIIVEEPDAVQQELPLNADKDDNFSGVHVSNESTTN